MLYKFRTYLPYEEKTIWEADPRWDINGNYNPNWFLRNNIYITNIGSKEEINL